MTIAEAGTTDAALYRRANFIAAPALDFPRQPPARIFEKLDTVEGGLIRRPGGAGVALYRARKIVRLHGGRVDVHRRSGRGSVFSVRLPRWPQGPWAQTAHA
jgi:signal transduction histidine kinase